MGIRTVCLCLIQHNDHYLFQETLLKSSGRIMYRPVGGTMEPGEHSRQTVIREVREEIGADLVDPVLRYIIENHYEIPAHEAAEQSTQPDQPAEDTIIKANELCFIYTASIKDQWLYKQPQITGIEGDQTYTAVWKTLREIQQDTSTFLVPANLLELLLAEEEGRTYNSPLHHVIQI